jgi:hypothetical protein
MGALLLKEAIHPASIKPGCTQPSSTQIQTKKIGKIHIDIEQLQIG